MTNLQAPKTLLIVDDEEKIRDLLKLILHSPERTLLEAENGDKALKIVKEQTVDVVITDIHMPVMDGLKLCSEISSYDPDIPLLIITAYTGKHETLSSLRAGVFDFLEKPFHEEFICNRVKNALEKRDMLLAQKKFFDILIKELGLSTELQFSKLSNADRINWLTKMSELVRLRLTRLKE